MKNIIEVLNLSTHFLEQKGFQHPRRHAQDLMSRALGMKPMDLYLSFERPLTTEELEKCRLWLSRRATGEPSAYIDGKVEFLDCVINVTRDVLIPRHETEILADKIAAQLAKEDLEGKVLWDICAGSGCLGIALKKRFPQLEVVLSDVSAPALKVAAENARQNHADVALAEGDLFAPFQEKTADFVVCNPPYISEAEYHTLEGDVRDYEPKGALVSGPSGLEFYERLAEELPRRLRRPGKAWLELGGSQGAAIKEIFGGGAWKTTKLEKDWAGWDRFFFLENE